MLPFVQNFPFFCIFVAMISGIITPLIKKGKVAFCISAGAVTLIAILSAFLLRYTLVNGSFTFWMGHFPAPWGNEIRAGVLEALMALCFSIIMLLTLLCGRQDFLRDIKPDKANIYFLMMNLLYASMLALVYTNDLFTAYVFIEINAIAACAAVMGRETGKSIVSTIRYMIFGEIGSGLFLMGVVILYHSTGHLLMVPIHDTVAAMVASGQYTLPITLSMGMMVVGLAIKAGLFPFHSWLPDAYSSCTPASGAILSGLVSKGYIILLVKLVMRVFSLDLFAQLHLTGLLFFFGLLSMLYGSIMALKQENSQRMVAYSSVAQYGYIFMALGLGTTVGVAAACFQILAHAFTKPMIFTSVGTLQNASDNKINWFDLRGSGRRAPIAGLAFTVGGLSLCGIPLLAGFSAKFLFGAASFDSPEKMLVTLLALGVSSVLNALYYLPAMVNIWGPNTVREKQNNMPFSIATPVFLALNIFIGCAFYPILRLINQGVAML